MKILFSILSVLVVVIAGVLVVPSFIDWSKYSTQIKTQIEKTTGYKLDLNGKISASLFPMPSVTINKVGIDSAGAKGPVGFKGTAEEVSVSVALIPLLSGDISVSDVTLINPILTVKEQKAETQNQKKLNEITKTDDPSSSQKSQNIKLDAVYIEGAQITYQPLAGKAMAISIPKLSLNAQSLQGPFEFDGRVKYDGFDLGLEGNVGKMVGKEPFSTSVVIDGGAYALNYKGLIDTSKADPEVQGELSLKANSIQSLASQFGANDIQIKDQSLALTGLIAGNAKAIHLDNGQLNLGASKASMPVKFNYNVDQKKGAFKVQSLPGGGMVDLDIALGDTALLNGQVMIENIKALASDTLGVVDAKTFDNPQIPNKISGDIKTSLGDVLTLTSNNLSIGDYKLTNTNAKYINGDKPKIDVSIGSFEGAKVKASGVLDMAQGVNVSVSHPNAVNFIRVFQKDFKSSPNLTKPFAFTGLVLKDGDMIAAKNMTAKIGDISTTGELSINNSGAVPSIKANVNFDKLDTRALISGEKSTAVKGNPTGNKSAAQSSSTAAPWTRDAIDTSALRSINLELQARANELVHGTWLISNPIIDVDLNGGVLNINTIKGGLFNGNVDMSGRVEAKTEGQPLSISTKINASDVDLSKLVKAAMSQNKERVTGKGSFNLSLATSGLSSSALVYALNGDGKITTSDLILKGIDLSKVTEAISDESLTDLAAVVQGAFRSGETPFKPIDHTITIREGIMPINDFTLVSPTANIISNGEVSFARWNMNVKNTVDFTNPDDLPNVEMTIKGPLNAPQQNVASDVLKSFIMNKYGAKIQNKVDKLLGDKLKDTPAAGIINNLLGLPQKQPSNAVPANDNDASVTPDSVEPKAEPKIEEQLIKGLFDQLGK